MKYQIQKESHYYRGVVMKILIVNKQQFGYHIDSYYYCKYLPNLGDEVDYICFDYKLKRIDSFKTKVHYVQRTKSKVANLFRFLSTVHQYAKDNRYDVVFFQYFMLSSLMKILLPKCTFNFDIRTMDVTGNKRRAFLFNTMMQLELYRYENISIISESLAARLKWRPYHKKYLLPLPIEIEGVSDIERDFTELNLIYVGTFEDRLIHESVEGFAIFKTANPEIKASYTIIGFCTDREVEMIKEVITKYHCEDYIHYIGRVPHNELHTYFDKANIGVAYAPIKIHNCQPLTKTYEYLLSGMAAIVTSTFENKKIVLPQCGVLCNDNPQSFADSLMQLYQNRDKYNSASIKKSVEYYTATNVVSLLHDYLETLKKSK